MRISESPTRDCALADLTVGVVARVVALDRASASQLAAHGVHIGTLVSVENDAPFGGPRIVRLGQARLALARRIARTIHVRIETDEDGPGR